MAGLEKANQCISRKEAFYDTKLYGFVCFVLNQLLRQDRVCEALPANTYPHWYGNTGVREEGGS